MDLLDENDFLRLAVKKARESFSAGGFPAGAIIVKDGKIIGEGISVGNRIFDPTSHGEIAAIRNACRNLSSTDLKDCVLYASMQPCLMCLGAAMWGSVGKIIYACPMKKVSPEYYGGYYDAHEIGTKFLHPVELIHHAQLEEESLTVVREWEASLQSQPYI